MEDIEHFIQEKFSVEEEHTDQDNTECANEIEEDQIDYEVQECADEEDKCNREIQDMGSKDEEEYDADLVAKNLRTPLIVIRLKFLGNMLKTVRTQA